MLKTAADGGCALDAMCLMLGLPRTLASRKTIRHECANFARTHIENRALNAMLHTTGEMSEHLGLEELEASGGLLMTSLLEVPAPAIHHGHGDDVSVHVPAGIAPAREYSPEEIGAVAWKCRMKPSPPDRILQVLEQLPTNCINEMVEEFKGRPVAVVAESKAKSHFIISRGNFLKHKREAVQQFVDWVGVEYGDSKDCAKLKQGLIPRGWFVSYVRAHEPLLKACKLSAKKKVTQDNFCYKRIQRNYSWAVKEFAAEQSNVVERRIVPSSATESAVAESDRMEVDHFARFRNKTARTGAQYYSSRARFKRDACRRRAKGAGRRRSCTIIREMLIMWYSIIRHSVNVKIMCRFPKKVLLVKALMLQQDYYASCLRNKLRPEHVLINGAWLNDFLDQYRISQRRPNRKFKVPREVLKQRLKIFWLVVAVIRTVIDYHHGYDPKMRNLDQSPFHRNEAGSAECNTLALKGAPTVPLIEDHAATRERWSLNSVTDSCEERVRKELPGFELMFRFDGSKKQAELQAYVDSLKLPFKVSVVTGPSGSYKEEDIIAFLELWLEPWGPGREWEIMLMDAYAPGLTDNVQRLCWGRGYINITHGGGASMILQTNDTDHHEHVRKRFIELQTQRLITKTRMQGGGMADLDLRENIDIMIRVMSDLDLHLTATAGYLRTGTTNALNGDQDTMIKMEAAGFWKEMDMRTAVNAAVADAKRRCIDGEIPWTYAAIMKEIKPYPNKHCLHVILPGQEDEATIDPDGRKWDEEEPQSVQVEESDAGGPVEYFCAGDWVDGADAEVAWAKNTDTDAQHHGHGATALAEVETVDEDVIELSFKQNKTLRQLRDADAIFKDVGGVLGASLRNTLSSVVHAEEKKFAAHMKGNPRVIAELEDGLRAEEKRMREARVEYAEQMRFKKETELAKKALKDTDRQLRKRKQDVKHQDKVLAAMATSRAYTLEMLGATHKKGGTKEHAKNRSKVLDQLREVGELSAEQTFHWTFFKVAWDTSMVAFHKDKWAGFFAEMVQKVLQDLLAGQTDALSVFVETEKARVLSDVPALWGFLA